MSKKQNMFQTYKSAESQFKQLDPCVDHPVRLARWGTINSFQNIDGTSKTKLPAWEDSTPQIFAILVSALGMGSIVIRLNGCGYEKYEDLTKAQANSGKFEKAEDYAITLQNGHMVRKENKTNTESCRNILDQFFGALELPLESTIDDLDAVVEDQRQMLITVTKTDYDGKPQFRASRYKKPTAKQETANTEGPESWSSE